MFEIMHPLFGVLSRYTTAARNKTDVLVSRVLESINIGQVETLLESRKIIISKLIKI